MVVAGDASSRCGLERTASTLFLLVEKVPATTPVDISMAVQHRP